MLKYPFTLATAFLCLSAQAANLRVVAEDDWYPYSAEFKGKPQGLSVDLVNAAYRAVGQKLDMGSMPYARCMKLLEMGNEIACFNSSKDTTTLPKYMFSDAPLYSARISIYARAGNFPPQAIALSDLMGKKVGLTNGYTYGDAVEQSSQIIKDYSNSDLQSLKKLAIGRLDYVLAFDQVGNYLISKYKSAISGKIAIVGIALEVPIYVTFSVQHPKGRSAKDTFDKGFALIRKNGTYDRIMQKWKVAQPIATSGTIQ